MDAPTAEKLTDKQQIWLKHIETAKAQGMSLSQYARDNDLKLSALYNCKWVLKKREKHSALTKKPFIKVARSPQAKLSHMTLLPSIQIRFPNQAQIDIQTTSAELPQLLAMIKSL